jgi:hypothetical protein
MYYEKLELTLRLRALGYSIVYVLTAIVCHKLIAILIPKLVCSPQASCSISGLKLESVRLHLYTP